VHRLFEDTNVIHVLDRVDALRDQKIIESELILADLQTVNKQNERKPPPVPPSLSHIQLDKDTWQRLILRLRTHLDTGTVARKLELNDEEKHIITQLNLLTMKPAIHIFNLSEPQLKAYLADEKAFIAHYDLTPFTSDAIFLSAKLESDLASFPPDEAAALMAEYGLVEPGLNKLIKHAYRTLGLISFLTAGEQEARAWTIRSGTTAPQAAGVIHSDFEKHFVKADIVPYQTFVSVGGWHAAREKGVVQVSGKDYVMKDGDVVEFKVNV
jgi:GTP-binding protein YchF